MVPNPSEVFGRVVQEQVSIMMSNELFLLVAGGVIGTIIYYYQDKLDEVVEEELDESDEPVYAYSKPITAENIKADVLRGVGQAMIKTSNGLEKAPEFTRRAYWTFVTKLDEFGEKLVEKGNETDERKALPDGKE